MFLAWIIHKFFFHGWEIQQKPGRETPQVGFSNEDRTRCVSNSKFAVFGTF